MSPPDIVSQTLFHFFLSFFLGYVLFRENQRDRNPFKWFKTDRALFLSVGRPSFLLAQGPFLSVHTPTSDDRHVAAFFSFRHVRNHLLGPAPRLQPLAPKGTTQTEKSPGMGYRRQNPPARMGFSICGRH